MCEIEQKRRGGGVVGILAAAWCLAAALAGRGAIAGPEPSAPGDVGPDVDQPLEQLVRRLSDPDWRTREAATFELMDRGPDSYETLREAFQQSRFYDLRQRISLIAREIHVSDSLGPAGAFLGIRLQDARWQADRRVVPGMHGIALLAIVPGSAAERAGLLPDDLLLSLNGQFFEDQQMGTGFSSWIARQQPGTPCRLGLLRGGKGIVLDSRIEGFHPNLFTSVSTRLVTEADDRRIARGMAALEVIENASVAPEISLQRGDLITALDDRALPADRTEEVFSFWANGPRRKDTKDLRGLPPWWLQANGAQIAGSWGPSIQILRGGRWMEVDVVLGHKRAYQPDGTPLREDGVLEAEAGFEEWWREWFAPNEPFFERSSARALWNLQD